MVWARVIGPGSFVIAAAATAAPPLDQSTLIDRLADEGMGELLEHLVATEPPADPVVASQVQIAAAQIRYRAAQDPGAQATLLEAALQALRDAIQTHRDHPQRAVWQTDLAELLLTDFLAGVHQHAADFYEFGIPTPAQRQAYERSVPEALAAATDADRHLTQLQSTLPRAEGYEAEYVRTGLEQRYFEEYANKRTRYYLALAAHLATLLPDRNSAEERDRLASLAIERVEPFIADTVDTAGVRLAAMTLRGRAQLALGKPREAVTTLQHAAEPRSGDRFELEAHLAASQALVALGNFVPALERLALLREMPLVRDNVLLRLLVADAEHRVRRARVETLPAEQRPAAMEAAYEPYIKLLDDPSLGESAEPLRNYVSLRWDQTLDTSGPAAALPPIVRVAVAEVARIEGQNLALEAEQDEDPAKRTRARQRLADAIRLSEALRDHRSESIRGRALYNLGLAHYFQAPQDPENVLEAAGIFVELADELPAQRQALEALRYAMSLLREVHEARPRPTGADDAYAAAARVLFEKYGNEPLSDDERLYYGGFVLAPAGRYAEAAAILAGVPRGHRDYFDAQRELLFTLEEALRAGPISERVALRERLIDTAKRVQREASDGREAPEPQNRAAATAELVLAGAALEGADQPAGIDPAQVREAIRILDGFEQRYPSLDDLIRLAFERRVMAFAATRQLDELGREARAMMTSFPDAAAYVIDQVLTNLDREAENFRAQAAAEANLTRQRELQTLAEERARTASALADMLVHWAREQGYTREEMLPYQLVLARSRRLAGQPEDALAITADLARDFGENADVLHQHAESLFAAGGPTHLLAAAPLYDRLIGGLPGPPYPPLWWNAWMRRLQINDRLGQATDDIALRVRQLRLTDPNLGGRPYREALERLAEKHPR